VKKFVVARLGAPPIRGLKFNSLRERTDDELLGLGEPFVLTTDPTINRVPLVRLFGPGRYWKARQPDGFDVVGEGLDLWDDHDEMRVVLDERRNGMVRGKWFSRWCPDGEIGTRSFVELEPMTENAYQAALFAVCGSRNGTVRSAQHHHGACT